MKKEDVEKAANGFYEDNTFVYKGFIHGAVRKTYVEAGKMVLCETLCGVLIGGQGKITGELVRELGIRRWAYVEDLMPGKEVGI